MQQPHAPLHAAVPAPQQSPGQAQALHGCAALHCSTGWTALSPSLLPSFYPPKQAGKPLPLPALQRHLLMAASHYTRAASFCTNAPQVGAFGCTFRPFTGPCCSTRTLRQGGQGSKMHVALAADHRSIPVPHLLHHLQAGWSLGSRSRPLPSPADSRLCSAFTTLG